VYALGMMLYHILTGQDPYDVTGTILDVLKNIQGAEPVRPSKIIRKFDPDVEAILLTALAKDRTQRYQSVAGLQSDIENWLAARPISVRSISTLYLMRKVIARHRYVAAIAGLLLVIILSFSFISFDLYLTARAAQRDEEGITKQWSERVAQLEVERHRELTAAMFLRNPKPLKDKEAEFRQQLGVEQAWFADYVVGEHYLNDGNKEQALNAYRNSYDALQKMRANNQFVEEGFVNRVEARLYELTRTKAKPEGVSAGQPEEQKNDHWVSEENRLQ
jgi:serine/threonine protein kinase